MFLFSVVISSVLSFWIVLLSSLYLQLCRRRLVEGDDRIFIGKYTYMHVYVCAASDFYHSVAKKTERGERARDQRQRAD